MQVNICTDCDTCGKLFMVSAGMFFGSVITKPLSTYGSHVCKHFSYPLIEMPHGMKELHKGRIVYIF